MDKAEETIKRIETADRDDAMTLLVVSCVEAARKGALKEAFIFIGDEYPKEWREICDAFSAYPKAWEE